MAARPSSFSASTALSFSARASKNALSSLESFSFSPRASAAQRILEHLGEALALDDVALLARSHLVLQQPR